MKRNIGKINPLKFTSFFHVHASLGATSSAAKDTAAKRLNSPTNLIAICSEKSGSQEGALTSPTEMSGHQKVGSYFSKNKFSLSEEETLSVSRLH